MSTDDAAGTTLFLWDGDMGDFCEESTDTSWVATESFIWDEVGNPDAAGDSVEVDNRLVEHGSSSLSYDADGNIVSRATRRTRSPTGGTA